MDKPSSEFPVSTEHDSGWTGIPPSEALNRFEPPDGFVPVALETDSKRLRYGFRRGGLSLLVREGIGSEVVPLMPLATIPNGPTWLSGIINLRGNLVPVCDIRQVLGQDSETADEKTMILVLDKGDRTAGFLIDGYPIALTGLHAVTQAPALPDALAQHVPAVFSTEKDVWLEFDHEGFLENSNTK